MFVHEERDVINHNIHILKVDLASFFGVAFDFQLLLIPAKYSLTQGRTFLVT